ncbi:MAG TPA: LuxR C-terminal-related transcriptional regulator, partial [Tepidiformaceae bacterium]
MTSEAPISMRERLREDYRWTERQRQVLDLMARGKTNTEIAAALGLSLAGAKWHVSEILSKLNSDSREEAAEYWRRYNGLAPRFARVFRGFLAGGIGKAVTGGAIAIAAVGIAGVAVLWADNDNEPPDATARDRTPTVTPTPENDDKDAT